MKIGLIFTLIISKLLTRLLRLINRGGTTLPGKIACKIYPEVTKILADRHTIIMITGTNGKTTTARIIGQILKENGIDYIENKSGANLLSGVTTTLIESVSVSGKSKSEIALLEIDEAAFKQVSSFIHPYLLVVTNFFRDQLDRYGELYTTVKGVASGILKNPQTRLVLNGDDSLCASLGVDCKNEILYYGIDRTALTSGENKINSDAAFCIFCKSKYTYTTHSYAHLGWYECNVCGYRHPGLQVSCSEIIELSNEYSFIKINIKDSDKNREKIYADASINLPGIYNIYNALAATACACIMNLPVSNSLKALSIFKCGFGRMETLYAEDIELKVILVKNPTGFNQVIDYLLTEPDKLICTFLINDNYADGTDISWLWDVEFEKLQSMGKKICKLYTSGTRAEDMAVRLKYAGMEKKSICMEKNYDKLLDKLVKENKEKIKVYLLPTYTSMMDLRKILASRFDLPDFWK